MYLCYQQIELLILIFLLMYKVSDFEGFLVECNDFQTAESQVINRFHFDNLQCLIIEPNGNVLSFNQVYNFDNHYYTNL